MPRYLILDDLKAKHVLKEVWERGANVVETNVLGTVVECEPVVAELFDLIPIVPVEHVVQYA